MPNATSEATPPGSSPSSNGPDGAHNYDNGSRYGYQRHGEGKQLLRPGQRRELHHCVGEKTREKQSWPARARRRGLSGFQRVHRGVWDTPGRTPCQRRPHRAFLRRAAHSPAIVPASARSARHSAETFALSTDDRRMAAHRRSPQCKCGNGSFFAGHIRQTSIRTMPKTSGRSGRHGRIDTPNPRTRNRTTAAAA